MADEKPTRVVVYSPESPIRHPGAFIAAMGRDILAGRGLAWRLFVRDTRAAYRQSYLGYLWAVLPPLATTFTFSFLNSQNMISIQSTPVAYPAFVMIGTLLWQAFIEALNSPMAALQSAKSMLTKINFPREALIVAEIMKLLFNLAIRLLLLIPLFFIYKIELHSSALLFPLGLGVLIMMGMAIGLWLVPVGMLYLDVGRGLSLISGFWMLLTPVVYPPPSNAVGAFLAKWNPVSPVLLTARDWLIGEAPTHLAAFGILGTVSLVVFFLGWLIFRITMPMLVERMGG